MSINIIKLVVNPKRSVVLVHENDHLSYHFEVCSYPKMVSKDTHRGSRLVLAYEKGEPRAGQGMMTYLRPSRDTSYIIELINFVLCLKNMPLANKLHS